MLKNINGKEPTTLFDRNGINNKSLCGTDDDNYTDNNINSNNDK